MLTETEVKDKIRDLAINKMLEKIKNEYNNSGKYWKNLGEEKAFLEKLESELEKFKKYISSEQDDKEKYDKDIAKRLESLENAFLYTISKLPWKDRKEKCHYPVGENKVTDKFLDKVADAINGKAEQLNGENFATVLLPNKPIKNANIKYAIPQCIKGDITSAKLYHCLLNPGSGISDKENQYDNFYDYLHDNAAMKDHLRIFDENGHVTKEKLVEYMNDLNKSMFSIEYSEFLNDLKLAIKNVKVKKISLITKAINRNYYLPRYYASLLVNPDNNKYKDMLVKNIADCVNKDSQQLFENKDKIVKQVSMCNLELIPLRSQDGATIGNFIDENPFAVNIILRRIYIYELSKDDKDSVQPIFIFRSYGEWKKRINEYIKRNFEKADAKNLIDYLTGNYFLRFINSNGITSKNNTRTVEYGIKLSSAYAFVESLNKEGVDFDTIIPEKLELIEENEFTKENANHGKVSIINVKYDGKDFSLETAEQKDDKIRKLFFTNNLDKERLVDEIKLAMRAYKYINDAQNAFTSGLETE